MMNKGMTAASIILLMCAGTANAVEVDGSIRLNYAISDYSDASKKTGGDFDFNLLAIKVSEDWGDYGATAEYRFGNSYDYLKYAYAYWNADEDLQFRVGVVDKAFGNKNFASHNWWYSLNYYLGFEDDWGVGANVSYKRGAWETEASFHQGSTYSGTDYRHYAATISPGEINGTQYSNEERNTVDVRQSYHIKTDDYQLLLGGSVEYGQLYNTLANKNGDTFSWALHGDLEVGSWGAQLQYLDYDFDQYDDGSMDTRKIGMAVSNGAYEIAAKGKILTANVSKKIATEWGSIVLYNDFSMVQPDEASFDDSLLNSTGFSVAFRQFFVYVDYYTAKNVVWLGGDNSLGVSNTSDDWNGRFNINMQYYF